MTFVAAQGLLSRLDKIRRRVSGYAPTMAERLADKVAEKTELEE